MLQEIRYALRTLMHAPSFTASAVLTLAVGIALNTLVFTLLDSLALRPMPVRDPARVVRIFPIDARGQRQNLFSYPDYLEYRAAPGPLQGIAAYIPVTITARFSGDEAQDLVGYAVSSSYFPLLGIEPSRGRPFSAEEERPGAVSAVAVISDSLWRRRFAASGRVLGERIVLNDRAFTIIGVGPERFMGTEPLSADVWVPIGAQPIVAPEGDLLHDRQSHWLAGLHRRLRSVPLQPLCR